MIKNILNNQQKKLLKAISESNLKNTIYWTGGTALSNCYFQHRLSTDIDLFTKNLIDDISLQIFIKQLKEKLNIKKIKHLAQANRNIYDLDGLKLEIVYFPFELLGKNKRFLDVKVDSLTDIATNKILALYQRNDPKDIFDLYFILEKGKLKIDDLLKKVEQKFGEKLEKSLLTAKIQKNLINIDILKPLVFDKNIFKKIKKYFQVKNKKYLFSILL